MKNFITISITLVIGIILGVFIENNLNIKNLFHSIPKEKIVEKVENPYKDKLEINVTTTGYFSSNVWKPYIEFSIKNISGSIIEDYINLKVEFIDQDNGEKLGNPTKTIIAGYNPLESNSTLKHIAFMPVKGTHGAKKKMEEKNVIAKVYLEDVLINEIKIENKKIR